jgi:hypothetical protein
MIKGVSPWRCQVLKTALNLVVAANNSCASSPLNGIKNCWARRLIYLPTRWRTALLPRSHTVVLRDFKIGGANAAYIQGTAGYRGAERQDVQHQLNWILAWITFLHPTVRFTGRIHEYAQGDEGGKELACYCPQGIVTRWVATADGFAGARSA